MSSGDIVSVIGGGTYLSVTGGADCSASDCILEIDPKTGAMERKIGALDVLRRRLDHGGAVHAAQVRSTET